MATQRKPTQRPNDAPGVRLLLSAAAVSAIVGGWAGLANAELAMATESPPPAVAMVELPPIPTVLPLDAPMGLQDGSTPSYAAAASNPPAPLRRVTAPPQPVARTRSSR